MILIFELRGFASFSDWKTDETFPRAQVSSSKQVLTPTRFILWKFWASERKEHKKLWI